MTMKSTLIVPITHLAALAAGVLVHDRLRTKSLVEDGLRREPHRLRRPSPLLRRLSPPAGGEPLLMRSDATHHRGGPLPVSAPTPATPEPEPPRMTASQEASLDAWMIKTYLGCWKPAAQPADADRYVARVRLKFKADGSLLKPPKLVNPPSDPAQKPQAKSVLQAVKACDPLPMPAQYRSYR